MNRGPRVSRSWQQCVRRSIPGDRLYGHENLPSQGGSLPTPTLATGVATRGLFPLMKKPRLPRSSRYSAHQLEALRTESLPARPDAESWSVLRTTILERDGWTCQLCGVRVSNDRGSGLPIAQVDHIRPLYHRGYPTDPSNLQAVCRPCNIRKGKKYRGTGGTRLE